MTGINVKEGEPYESFIRRFRKVCDQAGILKDFKRHERYEKPSEKKKRKSMEARRKVFRKGYRSE